MTSTATAAPYTVGQNVEIRVVAFAVAGMPYVWLPAVVTAVVAVDRLFDVTVTRDGVPATVVRVGPRAGGKTLRRVTP